MLFRSTVSATASFFSRTSNFSRSSWIASSSARSLATTSGSLGDETSPSTCVAIDANPLCLLQLNNRQGERGIAPLPFTPLNGAPYFIGATHPPGGGLGSVSGEKHGQDHPAAINVPKCSTASRSRVKGLPKVLRRGLPPPLSGVAPEFLILCRRLSTRSSLANVLRAEKEPLLSPPWSRESAYGRQHGFLHQDPRPPTRNGVGLDIEVVPYQDTTGARARFAAARRYASFY